MNIKEAKQEIKNTVQAYLQKNEQGEYRIPAVRQRPVLLMGPPGIGKTQIMEQIARECRIGLVAYTITHHTRQSAVGLPFIQEKEYDGKTYSVTEYTMSEIIASIYENMEKTGLREGILFIDEINCVSETLAPTMLQFLQCKTFGNQAVPEGWIIVAAGNPPEYNKSVRDFDMVTWDRVRRMDVEADYTVWKEYARKQKLHGALLSYLELRPKNFYRVESDVDGLRFVTARGWEDFSNLLQTYEELGLPVNEAVVGEFIHHPDVAEDVAAYIDLYQKYQDDYGILQILQGQVKTEVYTRLFHAEFDERVSVVNLLLDGLLGKLHRVSIEKRRTDIWYEFLKEYRGRLDTEELKPEEIYQNYLSQMEQQLEQKKAGKLLERQELHNWEWLLAQWAQYIPRGTEQKEEVFDYARTGFDQQRDVLENGEKEVGQWMENAFDFMEAAFPDGQEMILFVTELTVSAEAAVFLADNPCERYMKYNQELLIGSRKRELLNELHS